MEIITVKLPVSGQEVQIQVQRKYVKNISLRVYPDKAPSISLPYMVSLERAKSFAESRAAWIEEKLQLLQQRKENAGSKQIDDGGTILILGQPRQFILVQAQRDMVKVEGSKLYLYCRDITNQEYLQVLLERWWRREADRLFWDLTMKWHRVVWQYNVDMPVVRMRKMKTRWGSCSLATHSITYNYYLLQANPAYTEYVVFHELAHFIHPNHSKEFYEFIEKYMPDWQRRKEGLDRQMSKCWR